jgi:hypothetical protein
MLNSVQVLFGSLEGPFWCLQDIYNVNGGRRGYGYRVEHEICITCSI